MMNLCKRKAENRTAETEGGISVVATGRLCAFQIKEQPELEQAHGQIWMLEENWFSIIAFMKNKSLPLIAAQ